MGRRKAPRRRTNGMRLNLYYLREVEEGKAKDVTIGDFACFPPALSFRPVAIHWQIAMSGSASSDGNLVHRTVAAQIQFYSPVNQTTDQAVWSSSPILVPWGQRIQGRRRINVPWFSANVPTSTRIARVETLCLLTDTATVFTSWIVNVTFEFGRPDFTATCPKLERLRFNRGGDDDDESSSSFSTLSTV